MLKERGISSRQFETDKAVPRQLERPRITIQQPRQGFLHPARPSDVLKVLEFIGPESMYGLRFVTLQRTPEAEVSRYFGYLDVPGHIILFEQPMPPWCIAGIVDSDVVYKFERSGAFVKYQESPEATIINWPENTLKHFMLFDVLLHELGHHVLQHNKGKRPQRIARTVDHESFADAFAARIRDAWFDGGSRP